MIRKWIAASLPPPPPPPGLRELELEATGAFGAAAALALPEVLGRPSLDVGWRSTCDLPSLYLTRGFGAEP